MKEECLISSAIMYMKNYRKAVNSSSWRKTKTEKPRNSYQISPCVVVRIYTIFTPLKFRWLQYDDNLRVDERPSKYIFLLSMHLRSDG